MAVSASALWVNFDVHKTVTMTMNDLPGAVLSPVDRRRSQPHFLRLTTDLPSEPLNLDGETECIVRAGGEVLRAPGFVVKRLGCCGQELAHVVNTDLVTADPSHEGNVVGMRPQFKVRPRVTAGVLPEGVMAPLDELTELGSVCIRSTCCRLHNFSFSCTNTAPAHRSGQRPTRPPASGGCSPTAPTPTSATPDTTAPRWMNASRRTGIPAARPMTRSRPSSGPSLCTATRRHPSLGRPASSESHKPARGDSRRSGWSVSVGIPANHELSSPAAVSLPGLGGDHGELSYRRRRRL